MYQDLSLDVQVGLPQEGKEIERNSQLEGLEGGQPGAPPKDASKNLVGVTMPVQDLFVFSFVFFGLFPLQDLGEDPCHPQ